MGREENYVNLYQELYNDLVTQGMDDPLAQELAYSRVELAKDIIEDVIDETSSFYCSVRKTLPIQQLEGWWDKTEEEKKAISYHLGFDIRLPWKEEVINYREGNMVVEGMCIIGSERVDEEWAKSGFMTWEAELQRSEVVHGAAFAKELERKMAGH